MPGLHGAEAKADRCPPHGASAAKQKSQKTPEPGAVAQGFQSSVRHAWTSRPFAKEWATGGKPTFCRLVFTNYAKFAVMYMNDRVLSVVFLQLFVVEPFTSVDETNGADRGT